MANNLARTFTARHLACDHPDRGKAALGEAALTTALAGTGFTVNDTAPQMALYGLDAECPGCWAAALIACARAAAHAAGQGGVRSAVERAHRYATGDRQPPFRAWGTPHTP